MISNLDTALRLDWKVVVFGVAVFLVVLKDAIDVLSNLKRKLRIKFGYEEEKDKIEHRIDRLERHDKEQYEAIKNILLGIDKLNNSFLEKAIEDYRFEILNMASGLGIGLDYSQEQYNHIISIHNRYEELLKNNGMTNGQVDASMEVIMEKYKEHLKSGF